MANSAFWTTPCAPLTIIKPFATRTIPETTATDKILRIISDTTISRRLKPLLELETILSISLSFLVRAKELKCGLADGLLIIIAHIIASQYVNNASSVAPVELSCMRTFNIELALVQLLGVSVPELILIQLLLLTV
jgi:hypothetical protein